MKLYNFARLIRKYSVPFTLQKTAKGDFVGGKYVEGVLSEEQLRGAIVPLGERKIYSSGGTYTTQDRQLYMSTPLASSLESLKVVYDGDVYSVEEDKDYGAYADAYVYLLKWVSAFDRKQK